MATVPKIPHSRIEAEIHRLQSMKVRALRDRWREEYGEEPRSYNRQFLWRRLAWRIQERAHGGLSERARKRAQELAREEDIRIRPPKGFPGAVLGQASSKKPRPLKGRRDPRLPPPGAVLRREYGDNLILVQVLADGFEYEGKVFKSLTAVARTVTGCHWNGYHFFGLNGAGGKGKGRSR